MAIIDIQTVFVGSVSRPKHVAIVSNDTYGTVVAAGYLNSHASNSLFQNNDVVFMTYGNGGTPIVYNTLMFVVSINKITRVISLLPNGGSVSSGPIAFFSVRITAAALAGAKPVYLFPSSGLQQFVFISMTRGLSGVPFAGGGGDRLGQITDGTTVYSSIAAASMQVDTSAVWSGVATAFPMPTAVYPGFGTAPGGSPYFQYSGGTTDYATGTLFINGLILQAV